VELRFASETYLEPVLALCRRLCPEVAVEERHGNFMRVNCPPLDLAEAFRTLETEKRGDGAGAGGGCVTDYTISQNTLEQVTIPHNTTPRRTTPPFESSRHLSMTMLYCTPPSQVFIKFARLQEAEAEGSGNERPDVFLGQGLGGPAVTPLAPGATGGAGAYDDFVGGGAATGVIGPRAGMGVRYGPDGKPMDGVEAAILRSRSVGASLRHLPSYTETTLTGDSQSPPPPAAAAAAAAAAAYVGTGTHRTTDERKVASTAPDPFLCV